MTKRERKVKIYQRKNLLKLEKLAQNSCMKSKDEHCVKNKALQEDDIHHAHLDEFGHSHASCCNTKYVKTSNKKGDDTRNNHMFPAYFHWIVFVFTLVFRLHYVSQKTNWWILHPDEIYQSLEVAHSEIYRYGFRPYEYLPPPDMNSINITVARQHEYQLGMYSLRSFLLPRIFAYVGYMFIYFGYSGSLFLIWKCFHTSVTSILVISVYHFTKTVCRSHDTAVVSSILCSSSIHLNILGTHTLINSFLSPFVFFVLSYMLRNISNIPEHTPKWPDLKTGAPVTQQNHDSKYNNCINRQCHVDMKSGEMILDYFLDHNDNMQTVKPFNRKMKNPVVIYFSKYLQSVSDTVTENKSTSFQTLIAGFTFGLLIYLRPDTIIVMCITCFFLSPPIKPDFYLLFIAGMASAISIGIREDYMNYGSLIISPWQWIHFNIFRSSSTRLLGVEPTLFYLQTLIFEDALNLALSILTGICILLYILHVSFAIKSDSEFSLKKVASRFNTVKKLCAIVTCILFIYSTTGHKETRFVHDTIPLLLVIFSEGIMSLCRLASTKLNIRMLVYSSLALIMSSQLYLFTSRDQNYISKWTYRGINNSNHVNICLDFIGNQNDVTGVFIDSSIHMTGGYTILRQNVPIIALSHREFLKFESSDLIVQPTIFNGGNVSIVTFNRISDFISLKNTQYLLKVLISESAFNYLVMRTSRRFVERGYVEVFKSGNMKVLKRILVPDTERALHSLSDNIHFVENTQVLNIEADWLIYYGAYNRAKGRLLYSLKINETNLISNQLLIQLYHMTGENKLAKRALHKCSKYHDKNQCLLSPKHDHNSWN